MKTIGRIDFESFVRQKTTSGVSMLCPVQLKTTHFRRGEHVRCRAVHAREVRPVRVGRSTLTRNLNQRLSTTKPSTSTEDVVRVLLLATVRSSHHRTHRCYTTLQKYQKKEKPAKYVQWKMHAMIESRRDGRKRVYRNDGPMKRCEND